MPKDACQSPTINSQEVTSSDIVFLIMQHSDSDSPLADIRCLFNNASMQIIDIKKTLMLNNIFWRKYQFPIIRLNKCHEIGTLNWDFRIICNLRDMLVGVWLLQFSKVELKKFLFFKFLSILFSRFSVSYIWCMQNPSWVQCPPSSLSRASAKAQCVVRPKLNTLHPHILFLTTRGFKI